MSFDIEKVSQALVNGAALYIDKKVAPVLKRIKALESRLYELEAREAQSAISRDLD